MEAIIYSNTTRVGTANLSIVDEGMGVVGGSFTPNAAYSTIQPIVRTFNESVERDYKIWNALNITVQLTNDYWLFPQGGVSIMDFSHLDSTEFTIDIAGVYHHVLRDFFKSSKKDFTFPIDWRSINIETKLALEAELELELAGTSNTIISNLLNQSKSKHVLGDVNYAALAVLDGTNDVLFSIHGREQNKSFAVVHLTWKHEDKSDPKWPSTYLLNDYDEFVKRYTLFT